VQDFWPSFTDVMSTVAMLLFFLMLLSYIQNIMTGRRLEHSRGELETARQSLADARRELDEAQSALGETQARLAYTEQQITEKENALLLLENEVERTRAEVEQGQRELTLSNQEIESQREIIAMSNQELGDLRAKLSDIAVLRVDILDKVRGSIETAIGKYTDDGEERVTIGPNANIIINERLLFDYGSSTLKDDAKQLMTQLSEAFERLLDDEATRAYIDYISIEGHTDAAGSSAFNRGLSADRAVSVVNYMMEANPQLEEKYARYFGIGGFSKFRPLSEASDEAAMAQNRRIEISVVVKDDNIRKMIEDYLGTSAP
jgi:chemotaxis protein MotB